MLYNGLYKELCSGFRNGRERGTLCGTFSGLESSSGSATGGSIYEAETMAWVKQLSSRPSPQYLLAIDSLIFNLKKASIWDQLDRLWIFATEQQAHARVSLVNPKGIKALWPTSITEVNSPTWTAKRGYTGNGSSMYLNTNFNASTQAINISVNNNSLGVYSLTPNKNPNQCDLGANNGSFGTLSKISSSSFGVDVAVNCNNTSYGFATSNYSALISASRVSSSSFNFYQRGIMAGQTNQSSLSPLPNYPYAVLALNLGTVIMYSSKQLAMAFVGAGTIDQANFYSIIQEFATKVGFNV